MSELDERQVGAATPAPEATPEPKAAQPQPEVQQNGPVEGVDYNIPLTSEQKLLVVRIQNKALSVQKQIADLEKQAAKVETFFQGQLQKIAVENKIDMNKFVLSEELEIKVMPPQPQRR
jgi:adenine deaminase